MSAMPEPITRSIHSSKFLGLVWATAFATLASASPIRHLICKQKQSTFRKTCTRTREQGKPASTSTDSSVAHLVLLGQGTDVVLEGICHPAVFDPDIRYPLEGVPEVWSRPNSCVDELVKVLVVAENDVTAHVKEEALGGDVCAGQTTSFTSLQERQCFGQIPVFNTDLGGSVAAFLSLCSSPSGARLQRGLVPSCADSASSVACLEVRPTTARKCYAVSCCPHLVDKKPVLMPVLVDTGSCAQPGRASANDQNAHLRTVHCQIARQSGTAVKVSSGR